MGFDVEGLQNQRKYSDLSLGFNPQVLVTTLKSGKVDGLALAHSIRKVRGWPRIIALKASENNEARDDIEAAGIELVLDSPVNPRKLLLGISTLGGVDEQALLDKYDKIKGQIVSPYHTDVPSDQEVAAGSDEEELEVLSFDDMGQPVEEVQKVKKTESADSVVSIKRRERFDKCIKEMGELSAQNYDRNKIREYNKKIRAWEQPDDIEEIENERKQFVKALFKK
ncbi:MAG: hypothetical protein KDD38_05745 [Bdellovibrionales bacterium]|nr:hypothetical protein [Bdellovibrionales bacterium]